MKTKFLYFMLACIAMLACDSLTSCVNDDEKEPTQYYLYLDDIKTNCIENNNYTIDIYVPQQMENSNSMPFVEAYSDKDVIKTFDQYMTSLRDMYTENYVKKGILKENDYIEFTYTLYRNSWHEVASETILVTKDGVQ